jgi:hypothetical protein
VVDVVSGSGVVTSAVVEVVVAGGGVVTGAVVVVVGG